MIRRSWMMVASIETTLELWASSLREIKARMRPLFTQERVARSAGLFLDGLLGAERRKTGWMRAECSASIWIGTQRQSGWPFWRSRREDDYRGPAIKQAIFS